eukprot:148424-Rhodomonas_salina.2
MTGAACLVLFLLLQVLRVHLNVCSPHASGTVWASSSFMTTDPQSAWPHTDIHKHRECKGGLHLQPPLCFAPGERTLGEGSSKACIMSSGGWVCQCTGNSSSKRPDACIRSSRLGESAN